MNTNAYNLLITVSGPRPTVDLFAFALQTCTDDGILYLSWAAALVEIERSEGTVTTLTDELKAGRESTYAHVRSVPKSSAMGRPQSWHIVSYSNCAEDLATLTELFPELDIVIVEQQTLPSAGPLFYLTYYTGERHIEYRMSKSEASRRAMPGPRTPPPCPKTIEPRANRCSQAVQTYAG